MSSGSLETRGHPFSLLRFRPSDLLKRISVFALRISFVIACSAALTEAPLNAQTRPELPLTNSISQPGLGSESEQRSIWEAGVGEGFRPSTTSINVSAGATYGFIAFGSIEAHDLALVSLSYGHMLGHVLGEGHWYRGNPEIRLELFTGAQFAPSSEWLVGLTPHLRYNFATGTRWIPFVDAGAGVTATGIGPPDLSNTFEFNLQAGGGVQWFLKENVALSLEARYLHMSCAGISTPNHGLNGITGMLGLGLFF
jgi:lipid A 3-O-deacylase